MSQLLAVCGFIVVVAVADVSDNFSTINLLAPAFMRMRPCLPVKLVNWGKVSADVVGAVRIP